jgi:DNA-binding NarL/FixJ family response regulator
MLKDQNGVARRQGEFEAIGEGLRTTCCQLGGSAPPHPDATAAVSAILSRLEKNGCERLTPREEEVLALLISGGSDHAIARSLRFAVRTVRTHMESVHRKFHVSSRTGAAVVFALTTFLACTRQGHCRGLGSKWLHCHRSTSGGAEVRRPVAEAAMDQILTTLQGDASEPLTPREIEVMDRVLSGEGNKGIGCFLGVSTETIATLVARARRKLNRPSRASAAVAFALRTITVLCRPKRCGQNRCPLLEEYDVMGP